MCQIFTNLKNWFQQIFFPDEEEFIRRYIEPKIPIRLYTGLSY